jgi:hypothetical protein
MGNVLKYFGFAFIILAILLGALIVDDWGFSENHRFILALVMIFLVALALLIVMILATKSGDVLYSPYERSLNRGRNYARLSARRKFQLQK